MFVAGTDDGTVEIYRFNPDALKLTLTTTLNQHDRIVSSVAVKKESVLSASHDGLIHLWSISSKISSYRSETRVSRSCGTREHDRNHPRYDSVRTQFSVWTCLNISWQWVWRTVR